MLESAVRLSQAHARLMGRAAVSVEDAVQAIVITECQRPCSPLLGDTGGLHGDFPDDPDRACAAMLDRILNAIGRELRRPPGLLEGRGPIGLLPAPGEG